MKIQLANSTHTNQIFNTLKAVAAHMRAQGIMQWNENYPTLEHVEADIADQIVFIGWIDNELAGVISIDANQSPEYDKIPWEFTAGKVLVVHRLAVSPTAQKKGVGRQLMDFALKKAIDEGYSSIRLDAYSKNERTLRFYENRGYKKRGKIYFPYRNEPFYCYEKFVK
jgi:ribosomal protein S18 acetylase RimI-like enzyme